MDRRGSWRRRRWRWWMLVGDPSEALSLGCGDLLVCWVHGSQLLSPRHSPTGVLESVVVVVHEVGGSATARIWSRCVWSETNCVLSQMGIRRQRSIHEANMLLLKRIPVVYTSFLGWSSWWKGEHEEEWRDVEGGGRKNKVRKSGRVAAALASLCFSPPFRKEARCLIPAAGL
jgi:hypothetical protein